MGSLAQKSKPVKPAKPAFRERGAVLAQQSNGFSQWEMFEQVPDLQWPQSVRIFNRMEREDSRVSSLLSAITLPIRRAKFWIDPAGARDEVTEHVAQNIGVQILGSDDTTPMDRTRGRFSFPQHLVLALTKLQYGHSVFEQAYRTADDGLIWLDRLAPRPQRTISQWNVAESGALLSIQQWAPSYGNPVVAVNSPHSAPSEIPIDRLVVYPHDMEPGFWIGKSLLRPSYKHWLLKDELLRIQAMAIRRNGMGVPIATGADGATQKDLQKLAEMAQSFTGGARAGGAMPFGATLQLLGVQGNLPDIGAAIEYHDQMIAIAGLAHFLNLSGGGSYALASVQADVFAQAVQTFAESFRDIFNAHVIEDLVDVNWGREEPAPRLVFDPIGSQQDATAAALLQLVQAGVLVPDPSLERAIRQTHGLPAPGAPFGAAPTVAGGTMPAPAAPPPTPQPREVEVAASARRRVLTPTGQGALF
ncbi:phage portal protein family protein [Gordonia sp. KTR9]|uniref:phage portal protein family protein n=1 Tax=Gordonia sp. KTR9 TaxID=337191 RepID=UPI00027DD9B7|nr:hypothetical protein KTR9_1358 [Gordonia sp. KTR9]